MRVKPHRKVSIRKFVKHENIEMTNMIAGYSSITGENIDDLYNEIRTFLPYKILDRMIGHKASSSEESLHHWTEDFYLVIDKFK